MASLTGTKIKDTYDSLIKVSDNGALDGTLQTLTDGLGNNSALSLSTAGASVTGTLAVSGNAAFDTNTLFVDASNNRVGVGSSSPSTLLNLEGVKNTSIITLGSTTNDASWSDGDKIGGINFYSADASGAGAGVKGSISYEVSGASGASNNMIFRVADNSSSNNVERMRIYYSGDISFRDSSANEAFYWDASAASLGIGKTPSVKLDVNGEIRLPNNTFLQSADTSSGWIEMVKGDSSNNTVIANNKGASIVFNNNASTERMRIDSSGNVGIGTSSKLNAYSTSFRTLSIQTPAGENAAILELAGNRSATSGNQNGMIQFWNKTSTATETARISGNQDSAINSGMISFLTASSGTLAEKMRITSGGNVLVGRQNDAFTDNGHVLFANGGSYQVADGGACQLLKRKSSDGEIVRFYKDASQVGNISVTGSATAYNTSSDYRLKEDWIPMEGALDRVDALKPVNFAWKSSGDRVDGFLAHELQEVVPEAVTGEKDATEIRSVEVSPAVYEDVIHPAEEAVYETIEHPAIAEELDEEGNVIVEAQDAWTEEVLVSEAKEEWVEKVLVSEAVFEDQEFPVYQGIDQSKIVPLLVAAIQELRAEIEALKALS